MEKDEKLGSLADVLAQAFCINVAVCKKKKQKETQNIEHHHTGSILHTTYTTDVYLMQTYR